MTSNLLQTKMFIPQLRPDQISRPQLLEYLDQGLRKSRSLTLISAPAGYGKSTIVVAWIHERQLAAAWLTVDDGDNEPARFFAYLADALEKQFPEAAAKLADRLKAPKQPSPIALMTGLINDISQAGGTIEDTRHLLVLDDYQAISEAALYESVDFLLEHLPTQLHLVIITRQDPPLALSRLRGRGLISEIRQDDLRFDKEEVGRFLLQTMAIKASENEIAVLSARTEGWITGLQLAALSMQGLNQEEKERFLAAFSGRHHFILDYLTDEVLRRQQRSIQEFLLFTSILERLNGQLCDALLQDLQIGAEPSDFSNSQSRLEYLESSNLFLVPLDDERRWYRCHQLFAQLLQARLMESHPELVPVLHNRAAAWYEDCGFMAEAVGHALASGDMAAAADLIGRALKAFATWSQVEVKTFLAWLRRLPDGVLIDRPWLRLFESRSLFVTGETKHAEQSLKQLDLWLEDHPEAPEVDSLRRLVRADRASYAVVRGAVNKGIYFAQNALDNLAEDDHIGRMRAVAILGLAQSRCGNVRSAQEHFSEAIDLALEMNLSFGAVPLICNLSEVQITQGALTDALRSSERALELGLVEGQPTASSGFARLQKGKILYERSELAAAEDNLRQALQLLSKGGIAESFGSVQAVLALVRQAQGHPEEALALAHGAVETAKQEGILRLIVLAQAYQAQIWLAQGTTGRAGGWADNYVQLDPVEYLTEFEDLTLAKVLLAIDHIEEALTLLDSMVGSALDAGRTNSVIQIRLLQALGADALGKNQAALETLKEAVGLAAPEGYCRVFLDLGAPMAQLLHQLVQEGDLQAAAIIQAFDSEWPSSSRKAAGRQEILIEPLSLRELEVLQLLAAGHTNKEIAQKLFLSPNTVRSHTYNIYSKLDVHSRTQAAAKARMLGLLDPERPG